MGRFYKATPKTFVENKMFEIPFQEMATVMGKVDADIEKNENTALALADTLKLQALNPDKDAASKKVEGYESQIDSLVRDIHRDPLKYRGKVSSIRELSRTIQQDFETGDASKIQGNYDARQKNLADMEAAYKKNPESFNYEDISKLMAQTDDAYKGYQTGAYIPDMLHEFQDITDVEELAKGYKPDTSETLGAYARDGKLYTSKNSKEEVKPEQIRQDILKHLQSKSPLDDYYKQQIRLGNIDKDKYLALQEETADRLAEKYGYKKTSRGATSIKNDAMAVQERAFNLNSPEVNVTEGSIYSDPILNKYAGVDADGNPLPPDLSVAGINKAVGMINAGQQRVSATLTKLLGEENNIQITPEMATAIKEGDFSAIKGKKSEVTGKAIANAELYKLQQQYDALEFDKHLLEKKKLVAENRAKEDANYETADAYLADKGSAGIIKTDSDFQTLGIVSEKNYAAFMKRVKAWRNEISNSRAWHGAPLRFDAKQIESLPDYLQEALQDGTSVQDLINQGIIKVKTVGGKEAKELNPAIAEVYKKRNLALPKGKEGEKTDTYTNFSSTGNNAKPTLALDGSKKPMTQFEISIDGNAINVYMDEDVVSNKSITQFMDRDVMLAAHKYNTSKVEGVIDENDYYIDGLNFTMIGGQPYVNGGTTTLKDAFTAMAVKYKNDRNKMLKEEE